LYFQQNVRRNPKRIRRKLLFCSLLKLRELMPKSGPEASNGPLSGHEEEQSTGGSENRLMLSRLKVADATA
jgi:hypothetical protein